MSPAEALASAGMPLALYAETREREGRTNEIAAEALASEVVGGGEVDACVDQRRLHRYRSKNIGRHPPSTQ